MSKSPHRFSTSAVVTMMTALIGTSSSAAASGGFQPLADSLASPFVQSRAMVQILRADDPLDQICTERKFIDAWLVPTSRKITRSGEIRQRKWQEQWTLARCGTPIGYRVFFTEIGDGGVYFSVLKNDHIARPASLERAPRLADSVHLPSRIENTRQGAVPAN